MIRVNYLPEVYVKVFSNAGNQRIHIGVKTIDETIVKTIVPTKDVKDLYLKVKIIDVDTQWFQWFDIQVNDLRLRVPAIEMKKEIIND
jgi:hypothetical protein